jgi:tRNA(Ile)-lysidine synthase
MHPFETQLQIDWPRARWRDLTVLAAVSGGADSVALLRGLVAIARSDAAGHLGLIASSTVARAPIGRLVVAHYHHGLRGAEADADLQFVVDLCQELGVECVIGRADPSNSHGLKPNELVSDLKPQAPSLKPASSEEASRDARYRFLIATAQQLGARYVAVAHTADDQAETVLHHIVRGTGLGGLSGMPRARELADGIALVRPMLGARRAAARAYLADLGQAFREDSSNDDSAYTRNRLRNELLPALATDYNPQIVDALLRLGALATDAQELIVAQAGDLLERSVARRESDQLVFHTPPLTRAARHLVREMLMLAWREQHWPLAAMGHNEWTLLAEMATEPAPRKRVFPGDVIAERTADELTLRRSPLPSHPEGTRG